MKHIKITVSREDRSAEFIVPYDNLMIWRRERDGKSSFYFALVSSPNDVQEISMNEYSRIKKILLGK